MPRVEVCTDQYDLVLQFRISTGNLRNHVIDLRVVGEVVLDLQLHLYFLTLLQHTSHTAMILNRQDQLRGRLWIPLLILHTARAGYVKHTATTYHG